MPIVATGSEALLRARALLPTAQMVRGETGLGDQIRIRPGTIDRYGTIIIGRAYSNVAELKGDDLHATDLLAYLHNFQLDRMAAPIIDGGRGRGVRGGGNPVVGRRIRQQGRDLLHEQ